MFECLASAISVPPTPSQMLGFSLIPVLLLLFSIKLIILGKFSSWILESSAVYGFQTQDHLFQRGYFFSLLSRIQKSKKLKSVKPSVAG